MAALPLSDWRDFYVTIGTASGAIVGASFIVATLASELKDKTVGLRGFITPRRFIWAACSSGRPS